MKKKILSLLLVLMLTLPLALSVSAADVSYDLWVGGERVTSSNASDVLGDGTVSYDAGTNTLTLNGANITKTFSTDMITSCVYAAIDDLTVCLLGENSVTLSYPGDQPDGEEIGIFSEKAITVSGTGTLSSNAFVAVGSMQNVLIEDCNISAGWSLASAVGSVTVDGATLSAKMVLISAQGDITLKNTTVTDGGSYMALMTELGDVTIEDSKLTAHCIPASPNDIAIPICLGIGTLTVKNSELDLTSNSQAIVSEGGAGVFENVSGKIEVTGEVAYAMTFGGGVSMKGCDLDIVCRASEDGACGICTMMGDIRIEDSKLRIETRAVKEVAIAIGGFDAASTNVEARDSTLTLTASGPNAAGIYANQVKLYQSRTTVEATASANGTGFAAGLYAVEGRVLVSGGALDVTATGPLEVTEGPTTACILMENAVLTPEFVNADVKLRGNAVLQKKPDLSQYEREHNVFASPDFTGESVGDFEKDAIESIRYLHIYPLFRVLLDANGGTGEMVEPDGLYGEYTLPENGFEAPEGMVFSGWALTKDGAILEGESLILSDDVTLYAIWEDPNAQIPEDDGSEDEGSDESASDTDHTHRFGDVWETEGDVHYKACACGEKQYESEHVDSNGNGSCDVCGAKMPDKGCGASVSAGVALMAISAVCGMVTVGKKKERK